MKIILLGYPGAGKGELGRRLEAVLSIPHVSLGDRVRVLAKESTAVGAQLRSAFSTARGWAPLADDLAEEVARASVGGLADWILDGFPRNSLQAEGAPWLATVNVVFHLVVTPESARSRVLGRGREGDEVEKFERRLAAEQTRMPQLLELLRAEHSLVEVDADQGIEAVFHDVLRVLKEIR